MDCRIIDLIHEQDSVTIEFSYSYNDELYASLETNDLKEALDFFRYYREMINQDYMKVKIS